MSVITAQRDAVDYESITVAAAAIGLTATKVAPTSGLHRVSAFLSCETGQIRYRYDGTAPTSSEGHLMEVSDTLTLYGEQNLQNFKAIRTGGTSGTLRVTYHA